MRRLPDIPRWIITLPAGAETIDSTVATVQADGSLEWLFDINNGQTQVLPFWVRMPETAYVVAVEALMQVGIGATPDYIDHNVENLEIQLLLGQ